MEATPCDPPSTTTSTAATGSSPMLDPDAYDAQWRCAWCQRWYVIPGLARECEARHEQEAESRELEA